MMRIQFNEELGRLHHDILAMGSRVEEDLQKALLAFKTGDVALANEVKAGDELVNAMQMKIEDQAAMLIATQQPVAKDLRELVTIFKITDNLERIGDHAVHLAKAAKRLSNDPYPRPLDRLERMAAIDVSMVHDAVAAYLEQNEAMARDAAARDDQVDAEHKAFVQEVLAYLTEHPDKAQQATRLIATSSFLERLGDHVTNLCEAVVFMLTGAHTELNE
ncbi:MAG: phosphate transport system regulatory protein PhoU [Spirochaetae bacterium HGW-Spirochaetae-3]|jgi:phosphate transport system protein|nr:MAG: phosphate transport system regulatory protein PhoU [Spirochaetae bacterium HGW-Spirochaetae-3]